ncbi:MAG: REP-associated tyrosine transposase [Candidatus Acidiferrales bacterium]
MRRLLLSDRFFFITCRLLRRRKRLAESEFACLARVIEERRKKHGFLLTAWVFLPDHGHAIFFPRFPLTISRVMEATKVGSTLRLNTGRRESGLLWQPRFFDRALRTVKEYQEKVEYIHLNPVRAGLVKHPAEWKWSSYHEYAGMDASQQERRCGLKVDRVRLPAEERTRI